MRFRCRRLACLGFVFILLCQVWVSDLFAGQAPAAGGGRAAKKEVAFAKTAEGAFDFQTETIQGTIRLDGAYHGVTRLVDRRTGRQFIDPRYSALNLFKLMAVDQAMGMPRTMERSIQVSSHALEVTWAATDTHQGQLTARYEVCEPDAVDLTVTVRSLGTYPGYELFVSSYFDKALRPHVYLQPSPRGPAAGEADVVLPTLSDVFRGTVLVFPRDAHAARRCVDGRWERNERSTPTVQMCPVRRYAHCLTLLTDPEKRVGVALMSSPRHCYAISTRYHADDPKQRLTDYSAFDFSLFGDDLLPGDERTARIRLALVPLDKDLSQPLILYRAFLSKISGKSFRAETLRKELRP
jgi:hypothetical protein